MVVYALSDEARWQLLVELADGEPRAVGDLAPRVGKSISATSKHLKALRIAGIVRVRSRLHQLVERYRPRTRNAGDRLRSLRRSAGSVRSRFPESRSTAGSFSPGAQRSGHALSR
jgi:DNA-binding transcriptional ArsR family regulator